MTSSLSNHDSGADSRIAPRHQFEARIAIQLRSGTATDGWARDLSESGMGAFVGRALDLGETVTLTFRLSESVRLALPAEVVATEGTRYGFRFTALSADQRANIQSAIRNRPEIGADGRLVPAKAREHRSKSETGLSMPEPATRQSTDPAVADRARILIKRGYTPKVAVELVLHELKVEHGNSSTIMEKARADAEDFLLKVRRGLI